MGRPDNGIYTKQVVQKDGMITVRAINIAPKHGGLQMTIDDLDAGLARQVEDRCRTEAFWDGLDDGGQIPVELPKPSPLRTNGGV